MGVCFCIGFIFCAYVFFVYWFYYFGFYLELLGFRCLLCNMDRFGGCLLLGWVGCDLRGVILVCGGWLIVYKIGGY